MSAFFIATVTVNDSNKFQEYAQKAMESLKPFNGEIVIRGKAVEDSGYDHDVVGIFKFPDMQTLEDWYGSDAYQSLIPLREEASDMIITKYEEMI